MSEQKPHWKRVRFGEVVRLNKETCKDPVGEGIERYVGLEHLEPGHLRLRSWGDVSDGVTFTNRVRPGQVLFGKRRAYQRKVAVADFEAVCSGDIYVLESVDPQRLLPELLPFICQTDRFFAHAVGTSAGSLSPRTNWSSLAEYEFGLPQLEEQHRIVEALKASSATKDAIRDLLNASSLLTEAFCIDIATQTTSESTVHVGDLAKFTSGKSITVSSLPQMHSKEAPIPVYGGNGLAGYTSQALPRLTLPTIVIGRVGQFCGATRFVDTPAWITDNALYPVHIDTRVETEFLAIALRGCRLNQGKLGEYLPLVTQKVVHETMVPLPSLAVQREVILRLRKMNSAMNAIRSRVSCVEELHGTILEELAVTRS